MAGSALGRYGHIAVEPSWIPGCIAALMAGVAVGNRYPCQTLVGHVVSCFAVRRWVGAAMASGTRIDYRHTCIDVSPKW